MKLFQLIKQEMGGVRRDVLAAAAISGIANSGILAIVNSAAESASYETLNFRYFALFLITMGIYIVSMKFTFESAAEIFESMIDKIRVRISQKIRDSELIELEHIGKGLIFNRLVQDTSMISQFQGLLVAALQSAVLVACTALYMASLSLLAFLIMLIVILFATLVYYTKQKAYMDKLQEASEKEVALFGLVTHVLDGFKQVKMHRKRGDDLLVDFGKVSTEVKRNKVESIAMYNVIYIFSQCVFFSLMAIVVFILPRMVPTFTDVLTQLTAAVLFIIGPLTTVVMGIPAFAKANVATENIFQLESILDRRKRARSPHAVVPNLEDFNKITLRDLAFAYLDPANERLFQVGPLNLEIKRGEMIFIVGGNGSGKSTMLKMLTGLYPPQSGMLLLDDGPLIDERLEGYRELFSIIFGDFYLFDKLYGLGPVQKEVVEALIADMGLTGKTRFDGERFSQLDLSTGQRKRLALIVSLLEKKPIHIFDEWAADQDPEFRQYFYEVILQDLKSRGKTVIAVTHDDKYFHVADRVLKMEYGKIETILVTKSS